MASGEGGGSYWPGLVDALTNVVFALILFVMILALVFMSTIIRVIKLEQERSTARVMEAEAKGKPLLVESDLVVPVIKPTPPVIKSEPPVMRSEPELKREPPTQRMRRGDEVAVRTEQEALSSNIELVKIGDSFFVSFARGGVGLDAASVDTLSKKLEPHLERFRAEGVSVRADSVPAFVSEGRRKGYYRAVAVRNWLIEQGVPPDRVDVRISDSRLIDEKEGVQISIGVKSKSDAKNSDAKP